MNKLGRNLEHLLTLAGSGAIHIGLLGRGIGGSLSPIMHRREGERQGLDYHYHLVDFDSLGLPNDSLGEVLGLLQDIGFAGCNVTHPFKQAVIAHLGALSPEASAIGAVNTVLLQEQGRVGHNTDCWGFAESFRRGLPDVTRKTVLLIGAGGAGVAVARALFDVGVEHLIIMDTELERAQQLVDRLRSDGLSAEPVDEAQTSVGRVDGIVNATPIGMAKYPGSPVDPQSIEMRQWVADVIYFPRRTQLIEVAAQRGCQTLPGSGMAIFQAVKAFELFTGKAPSAEHMTEVFEASA